MRYLEWNHAIGNYFFNSQKAGKEVLLYISQKEISEIGFSSFGFNTSEESWADFSKSLKTGFPGTSSKNGFIEKFEVVNDKWLQYEKWVFIQKNQSEFNIDTVSIKHPHTGIIYPFYLGFLATLVIPLTSNSSEYNSNSYYPRLNDFLKKNNITSDNVTTLEFSYDVWKNLEKWSKEYYNTDIGVFVKRSFGNPRWKYVGKPFSQCILTPKNIREIPNLFWAADLAPNTFLKDDEIIRLVKLYGEDYLQLPKKVIDIVADKNDVLSKVIVDIIKREYSEWNGDVYEYSDDDEGKVKAGSIVAVLFSSFTIDHVNEVFEHQYFIYSKNDYPEDLHLFNQNVKALGHGFSNPIKIAFNQNIIEEDVQNKWKVTPNKSDIILYKNGSYSGLSHDIWIESEELSRVSETYLLCKSSKKQSIEDWGRTFNKGDFKILTDALESVPEGYCFYKFKNPQESHPEEPVLKFSTEQKIELRGGLKINNRYYLKQMLPIAYLKGGTGKEKLFLEYSETHEKLHLNSNPHVPEEYLIPNDIKEGEYFTIKIEGLELNDYEIPYKIIEPISTFASIHEKHLTRRNKYGEVARVEETSYVLGSNTFFDKWLQQEGSKSEFFSVFYQNCPHVPKVPVINTSKGNLLLQYLTCFEQIKFDDFSNGFDSIASHIDLWKNTTSYDNPKWIKQLSIQFYDFMGFLDYDYALNKVAINKPQIVIIPSEKNVIAILIGGRTSPELARIFEVASKNKINIEIVPQDGQLEKYLLPDTIKLIPAGRNTSTEAIAALEKLSSETGVAFNKLERPVSQPAIIQFGLREFNATIGEYTTHILKNKEVVEEDHAWARKVFNPLSLKFEKFEGVIDKKLCLIKYVFKYHKTYRLWLDGKGYEVDGLWGAYLIMSELKKNIAFYSRDNRILAIPRDMQLPRLASESLMLLSGQAPSFRKLAVDGNNLVYQFFYNVPSLFATNLLNKFKQTIQPLNL